MKKIKTQIFAFLLAISCIGNSFTAYPMLVQAEEGTTGTGNGNETTETEPTITDDRFLTDTGHILPAEDGDYESGIYLTDDSQWFIFRSLNYKAVNKNSLRYMTIAYTFSRCDYTMDHGGEALYVPGKQDYVMMFFQNTSWISNGEPTDYPHDPNRAYWTYKLNAETVYNKIKQVSSAWAQELENVKYWASKEEIRDRKSLAIYTAIDSVTTWRKGDAHFGYSLKNIAGSEIANANYYLANFNDVNMIEGEFYSNVGNTRSGRGPGNFPTSDPTLVAADRNNYDGLLNEKDGFYNCPESFHSMGGAFKVARVHFNERWNNYIPLYYSGPTPDPIPELPEDTGGTASLEYIGTVGRPGNKGENNPQNESPYSKWDVSSPYPIYHMWNTNGESSSASFDIGQGIPSSEYLHNYVKADQWYGTFDIGKHQSYRTVTIPYEWRWVVTTYTWHEEQKVSGEPPNLVYQTILVREEQKEPRSASATYTVNVPYEYYYILYMEAYALQEAQTISKAYGQGTLEGKSLVYNYLNAQRKLSPSSSPTNPIHVTINGEDSPTSVSSYEPNDLNGSHVQWAPLDTSTIVKSTSDDNQNAVKTQAQQEAIKRVDDFIKASQVRNDLLTINGTTYMDNTWVSMAQLSSVPAPKMTVDESDVPQVQGNYQIQIPYNTENGDYTTTMTLNYQRLCPYDATQTRKFKKSGDDASLDAYDSNEPVRVHTPVVAAVRIINPESKTQLITQASGIDELILDHTYTMQFDPEKHREIQGYNTQLYNQYTQRKSVRFPFDVEVDGVYYETDGTYTDWIDVSGSMENGNQFKFYVVPWAREGVYGKNTGRWDVNMHPIEFRVEAINSNFHLGDTKDNANLSQAEYVATYSIPVEVSGIIYNFQVVGINDVETFSDETTNTTDYAFCEHKEEKKSGVLNRLGGTAVRFTKDLAITNNWNPINILPFTTGKSKVYNFLGTLKRSHKISFSVETISNLEDTDDAIVITPKFTYVSPDGKTITDNIDVYYSDERNALVKVGSPEDLNRVETTYLHAPQFKNSYLSEDARYTANKASITTNELLNREVPCYSFGTIRLDYRLRLFTGRYEKLGEYLATNSIDENRFSSENQAKNRTAMQTWYGSYSIPANIYVCAKGTNISNHTGNDVVFTDGIRPEDDIWYDSGYLVLNFDIKTINHGHEALKYNAQVAADGGLNMWKQQGADTDSKITIIEDENVINPDNPDNPHNPDENTVTKEIPIPNNGGGDVIGVIPIKDSIRNRYRIGTLYTN